MYIKNFNDFKINENVDQDEENLIKLFRKQFGKQLFNEVDRDDEDYIDDLKNNEDVFITYMLFDTNDQFDIPAYKNGIKYAVYNMDSTESSVERSFYIFDQNENIFVLPDEDVMEEMFEFDDEHYFMTSFREVSNINSSHINFNIVKDLTKKVNK